MIELEALTLKLGLFRNWRTGLLLVRLNWGRTIDICLVWWIGFRRLRLK